MGRGIKALGDYSVAIALNDQTGTVVSQSNTMAIMGGNVGIGTTSPVAKLDVSGAIKLGNTPSPCDASHRGVMKFVKGGNREDDKLYICMKTSTGSYNWVLVARGG
jgi:hypothetical protein